MPYVQLSTVLIALLKVRISCISKKRNITVSYKMVILVALLCVSLVEALPLGEQHRGCGEEASDMVLHRDPWLVHLEYSMNGQPLPLRCAGVLVHPSYVLTAAHCLTSVRYNGLKVRLGEYDLNNATDCAEWEGRLVCSPPPLSVTVAEALTPAAYTTSALAHDLALLRLPRPVPFTDFIRPVCLPETKTHLKPNTVLHATGWGELINFSFSGQNAHLKKNVTLPLWDTGHCRKVYETQELPDAIICAGGEGADTCRGDSGGPLTLRMDASGRVTLVGVTAAGYPRCGSAGFPGVYTRVVDHLPWIRRILARRLTHKPAFEFSSTPIHISVL